jgi:hypothetical protein
LAGAKYLTGFADAAFFFEHGIETDIELQADALGVFVGRVEAQGAFPLEPRLPLSADHPVDVPEMVVDDRIGRQKSAARSIGSTASSKRPSR